MKINYSIDKSDYEKSLKEIFMYNFNENFIRIFFTSFFISLVLFVSLEQNENKWIYSICMFIFTILIYTSYYFYIPFLKSKNQLKNSPIKNLYLSSRKEISVIETGIMVETTTEEEKRENAFNWESIHSIIKTKTYWIIYFQDFSYLLINQHKIQDNLGLNNLIGTIRKNIGSETIKKENTKKPYWLGVLGFIPNIGVIIGAYLCFIGLKKPINKILIGIGLINIGFTFVFWNYISPKIFEESESQQFFTVHSLDETVKNIEFYKNLHGKFPENLSELKSLKNGNLSEKNQSDQINFNFRYINFGEKYMLKASGKDGIFDTPDDLYPTLQSKYYLKDFSSE